MKYNISSLVLTSLLLSNCASIVSNSAWPVSIQSQPSGMSFVVKKAGGVIISSGITPQIVTLNSGAGYFRPATYTIEAKRGGKVVGTQTLTATINGWYFGNILLGLPGITVGMLIIDPATGSMYRLPEYLNLYAESVTSHNAQSLSIVSIDTLTPAQRANLVRL